MSFLTIRSLTPSEAGLDLHSAKRGPGGSNPFRAWDTGFGFDAENQAVVVVTESDEELALKGVDVTVQFVWREPWDTSYRVQLKGQGTSRVFVGDSGIQTLKCKAGIGSGSVTLKLKEAHVCQRTVGIDDIRLKLIVTDALGDQVLSKTLFVRVYCLIQQPLTPWGLGPDLTLPWTEFLDIVCRWAKDLSRLPDLRKAIGQNITNISGGRFFYDTAGTNYMLGRDQFDLSSWLRQVEGQSALGSRMNCADIASLAYLACRVLGVDIAIGRVLNSGMPLAHCLPMGASKSWQGRHLNDHFIIGETDRGAFTNVDDCCFRVLGDDGTVNPVLNFEAQNYADHVLRCKFDDFQGISVLNGSRSFTAHGNLSAIVAKDIAKRLVNEHTPGTAKDWVSACLDRPLLWTEALTMTTEEVILRSAWSEDSVTIDIHLKVNFTERGSLEHYPGFVGYRLTVMAEENGALQSIKRGNSAFADGRSDLYKNERTAGQVAQSNCRFAALDHWVSSENGKAAEFAFRAALAKSVGQQNMDVP